MGHGRLQWDLYCLPPSISWAEFPSHNGELSTASENYSSQLSWGGGRDAVVKLAYIIRIPINLNLLTDTMSGLPNWEKTEHWPYTSVEIKDERVNYLKQLCHTFWLNTKMQDVTCTADTGNNTSMLSFLCALYSVTTLSKQVRRHSAPLKGHNQSCAYGTTLQKSTEWYWVQNSWKSENSLKWGVSSPYGLWGYTWRQNLLKSQQQETLPNTFPQSQKAELHFHLLVTLPPPPVAKNMHIRLIHVSYWISLFLL